MLSWRCAIYGAIARQYLSKASIFLIIGIGCWRIQELKFLLLKLVQFLPKSYTRQDVIAHGRHLGSFVHACHTHQENLAAIMMKDVIAEPYRESLLPNFAEVKQATRDLGALATGISGSGPTIFSIALIYKPH